MVHSTLTTIVPLLLLLASPAWCSINSTSTLTRNFLPSSLATSNSAFCNDGSLPAYYYTPATSASCRDRWVVHLEGGYWCHDAATCAYRVQHQFDLVSSHDYAPSMSLGGIFNPDETANPQFACFNKVYVKYCSSDGWAGTVFHPSPDLGNISTWTWRGKAIIRSVFEDLFSSNQLRPSSEVLFSGCSAGGQGVLVNLDDVYSMLTASPYKAQKVRGLADAGWLMDVEPYSSTSNKPLRATIIQAMPLWGAQFDSSCEAEWEGNQWVCFFGQYVSKYISTPFLVQAEQYDSFQLGYNGIAFPPANSGQSAWLDKFRSQFSGTISQNRAVFSAACHWHCTTQGPEFFTLQTSVGATTNSTFSLWYETDMPDIQVDKCSGLDCSNNCPA